MSLGSIMLVEGPTAGATSVSNVIGGAGFHLIVVTSLAEAIRQAGKTEPGLVLFDSGTLNTSGGCSALHNKYKNLPIIHIYPAGSSPNLTNGASAYLTRPLSKRKLMNRIQRLLPSRKSEKHLLRAGDVALDLERRLVTVSDLGETLMTPRQAELLAQFLRRPDELITRKELMINVWKTDYVGDTRTIDVHIRWVREKIEENPSKPRRLVTKRGQGYIFNTHPLESKQK